MSVTVCHIGKSKVACYPLDQHLESHILKFMCLSICCEPVYMAVKQSFSQLCIRRWKKIIVST